MDRHGQGLSEKQDEDVHASQDLHVVAGREVTDEDKVQMTERVSNSNNADQDEADDDDIAAAEQSLDEPEAAASIEALRIVEALLFASAEPLEEKALASRLPDGVDVRELLQELQAFYKPRGVHLVRLGSAWAFRTAQDLSYLMELEKVEPRRLSKAAIETLAIIAYHQPVTRAEIEDIRGVVVSKGTLDLLMELDWIKPKGRRRVPGRPLTYGTSQAFLEHFGLESVSALPGMEDLKAAGLLEARLPADFQVPVPEDNDASDDNDLDPIDGEEGDLPEFLGDADENEVEAVEDEIAEAELFAGENEAVSSDDSEE